MLVIKPALPRCNKIGFLTNKGVKPSVVDIDTGRVAVRYNDIGVLSLKPVIDRIKFGFTPIQEFMDKFDPGSSVEEYLEAIRVSALQDAMMGVNGLSMLEGVPFKKSPYCYYNSNLRFQPCENSDFVHIQLNPKSPGNPYIRFDMNPNRITPEGMAHFRAQLMSMLMSEMVQFDYREFLRWSDIYRVDVAMDILGVRPHDLAVSFRSNGKHSPQKSHKYFSKTGRVETIYPKVKAGGSTEYIYDRRTKQIEKGYAPDFGDALHTRYECRIGKTKFYKLINAKSRAARLGINALDLAAMEDMTLEYKFFLRAAVRRNLVKALDTVPPDRQGEMENIYKSTVHNIWNAKEIWSGWKHGLKNSGLFVGADDFLE